MKIDQDAEAKNLTAESWRPKMYGLFREGRKLRVSNGLIRALIIGTGVTIFGFQVFSLFKPSIKRTTEIMFSPPQVRSDIEQVYVPPIMNEKREAEFEKVRQRKFRGQIKREPVIIDRIKPIQLGRVAGIPSGSEVLAELKSGGTNGMIKVVLVENLAVAGDILLPAKSVLLGQGSSSEKRLYVAFHKAIMPDKSETKISALGYDEKDRMLGLKGKKISDHAFRLATSAGLIFLGGMADGMRADYSPSPFEQRRTTTRDAALNGVSTATSDMSRQMIDGMKSQQERVEVAHSTRLIIIFGDSDGKN